MDTTTFLASAGFTVAVMAAAFLIVVLLTRRTAGAQLEKAKQWIGEHVHAEAVGLMDQADNQLQRRIEKLQHELEYADTATAQIRSERMKAVSTFKSLDRERGSTPSDEADQDTGHLISIAQNPFVQGWASKWGIDPVKFMQGDQAEVDKVHALLPAQEGNGAAASDAAPAAAAAAEPGRRRVV